MSPERGFSTTTSGEEISQLMSETISNVANNSINFLGGWAGPTPSWRMTGDGWAAATLSTTPTGPGTKKHNRDRSKQTKHISRLIIVEHV